MSYNIAISLRPFPADDRIAWAQVDELTDPDGQPASELVALHSVLTGRYPCICDLPDDEVDDGVWSDGPLINNFGRDAAVIGMVYSRVDDVLPFVVQSANAMGMTVVDWATETIHRAPEPPPPKIRWWKFW